MGAKTIPVTLDVQAVKAIMKSPKTVVDKIKGVDAYVYRVTNGNLHMYVSEYKDLSSVTGVLEFGLTYLTLSKDVTSFLFEELRKKFA
jgi:hypothetical protein